MSNVRPFCAISPNPDKMDIEQFLFDRDFEQGFLQLAFPVSEKDDRSKYVKYAKTANQLFSMFASGQIQRHAIPSFYCIESNDSKHLLALIQIDSNHKTLTKTNHREVTERTWLTEATLTQFHSVSTIHKTSALEDIKLSYPVFSYNSGSKEYYLSSVEQSENQRIQSILEPMTTYIVANHELISGVQNYFENRQKRRPGNPSGHFLATFSLKSEQQAVQFRPITIDGSGLGPDGGQAKFREHFHLTQLSKEEMMSKMSQQHANRATGVFGLSLPGDYTFVAQAKDIDRLASEIGANPAHLSNSQVLQGFVFEKLFGLTGMDVFSYTKAVETAAEAKAKDRVTFFLGDENIESLENLAISSGVFPPRSVDISSAPPQGMAMWSLLDLQA